VVPVQPLADQEHPLSPEHAVDVVFDPHGVTVPAQAELQLQPDSPEHAVAVVFALQGVTVPPHVPGFQLQPYWLEQVVDVLSDAHGVRVPVQAVVHEQPALLQSVDEAYVSHVDGVPLQVELPAVQVHPMFRHATW
jgi:hypothetical protein